MADIIVCRDEYVLITDHWSPLLEHASVALREIEHDKSTTLDTAAFSFHDNYTFVASGVTSYCPVSPIRLVLLCGLFS